MKKILKSRIFLVIITIILSVGTTVCGTILYQANQVSYTPSDTNWNVTTVDEALNDLYNTTNTKLNSTTATAEDIISGKTAYSRGNLVTGTMANNGTVSATIDPGASYTIPAGYHNGSGTVTANNINSVGAIKLKKLGTYTSTGGSSSATFEISSITTAYASYSESDFILELTGLTGVGGVDNGWYDTYVRTYQPTKSYNSSTGVLTVSGAYFTAGGRDYNYGDHSAGCRMTFNVYVLLK